MKRMFFVVATLVVAGALGACDRDPVLGDSPERVAQAQQISAPVPTPQAEAVVAPAPPAASPPAARPPCTVGAKMFSRQDTSAAAEMRRKLGEHLSDLFCNVPSSDPAFHARPDGILRWPYGTNTPIRGEVNTTAGIISWEPDNR